MQTFPQLINRALHNLARNPMTRRQLYCARITNEIIEALVDNGHAIANEPEIAITDSGRDELHARIYAGLGSTLTEAPA